MCAKCSSYYHKNWAWLSEFKFQLWVCCLLAHKYPWKGMNPIFVILQIGDNSREDWVL